MNGPLWTVELHSHTAYSPDCLTRLDQLKGICQAKGIDKLAITDHNTGKAALELARLYPIWIIPGEEIMTTQGEILSWFIKQEVPGGLTPLETIGRLREQGAIIGVSHPFDRHRRGAWRLDDLTAIVTKIDAVEVFNSRCLHGEDNYAALRFATQHGKLMTNGSDAHLSSEYGKAVLLLKPFANTADSFRQALEHETRREVLSSSWVHLGSTYAKLVKKLLPSLRPK